MMLRDKILEALSVEPLKRAKLEEIVNEKVSTQLLYHFKKQGYVKSTKGVYSLVSKPKKYTYKRVIVKEEVNYGC